MEQKTLSDPIQPGTATEQPYLARRQNWTNQLTRHALMQPDAPALRFLGETTTWGELDRRVSALAGALHKRGIGFGDRVLIRRDRRRMACHVRQIAMYVCHVALRISQTDIGEAFGRDPQFAQFYRSLEAYKGSFNKRNDVMVVDPATSEFFRVFRGNTGSGARP